VPIEGGGDLVRLDAAAVVADADQIDAAAGGLDGDAGCSGVDGVLDKLFDDGRRAFHDLPRGDAGGDFWREHADRHLGRY